MRGDITVSKKESVDTSLKLVLVDLKQELDAGAERHLRDARPSGSEPNGRLKEFGEEGKMKVNY